MTTPTHCPGCKAKTTARDWHPDGGLAATMDGPWPVSCNYFRGTCPACRRLMACSVSSADPETPHAWMKSDQFLDSDRNIKLIRKRRWPTPLVGKVPVRVVWWWHPMAGNKDFDRLIARQLSLDTGYRRYLEVSILIYGPGMDVSWAFENERWFDQVWQADKGVLQDQSGPYTSVRAEESLRQTFGSYNLKDITYFWPGAFLPKENYRPVMTNDELAREWAQHCRLNTPIQDEQ